MEKLKEKTKQVLKYIFIDGFTGMAWGLFATLIIGLILTQIGGFIPGKIGNIIFIIVCVVVIILYITTF